MVKASNEEDEVKQACMCLTMLCIRGRSSSPRGDKLPLGYWYFVQAGGLWNSGSFGLPSDCSSRAMSSASLLRYKPLVRNYRTAPRASLLLDLSHEIAAV